MINVTELVSQIVGAAIQLLSSLTDVFDAVFGIVYDPIADNFTVFGNVLVMTAGFALAWAGIRLILSYIGKLLNSTRGGRR